jgi:Leucine-rich repeat (LRR) protein
MDASDFPTALLSFADLHLGQAVQSVIGKPLGEIRAIDLQKLQILDASHRGVIELVGIAQCPNLLDLNLSHNEIVDVGSLANLTKLERLDLSDNHLRGGAGIEGIAACENLGTLNLSGNELVDISLLAGLEGLTELNLSRNEITDVSPLLANLGLGSGDRVDLRLNPLDMGDASETRVVIEALECRVSR